MMNRPRGRQHRQTRYAMELSRGLILGRLWTRIRHFFLGACAISLGMLALTGHVRTAILSVCGLYVLSKACGWLRRQVEARCR